MTDTGTRHLRNHGCGDHAEALDTELHGAQADFRLESFRESGPLLGPFIYLPDRWGRGLSSAASANLARTRRRATARTRGPAVDGVCPRCGKSCAQLGGVWTVHPVLSLSLLLANNPDPWTPPEEVKDDTATPSFGKEILILYLTDHSHRGAMISASQLHNRVSPNKPCQRPPTLSPASSRVTACPRGSDGRSFPRGPSRLGLDKVGRAWKACSLWG